MMFMFMLKIFPCPFSRVEGFKQLKLVSKRKSSLLAIVLSSKLFPNLFFHFYSKIFEGVKVISELKDLFNFSLNP